MKVMTQDETNFIPSECPANTKSIISAAISGNTEKFSFYYCSYVIVFHSKQLFILATCSKVSRTVCTRPKSYIYLRHNWYVQRGLLTKEEGSDSVTRICCHFPSLGGVSAQR